MKHIIRETIRKIPDEQLRQPPYEFYGYVPKVKPKLVQDTTFRNILILLLTCAVIVITLFFSSCGVTPARAEEFTNEEIANAIYLAEGGAKTRHPYGILAHYKTTTPRQACINTIRHAKKDWNGKGDFISFLQKRYAPLGVSNDPTGLNKNWVKNVKQLLKKARS